MAKIGFEGRVLGRTRITGVERYAHEIYKHICRDADVKLITPLSTNKFYSHLWVHTVLPVRAVLAGVSVLFCPVMDAPVMLPRTIRLVVTIHDLAFLRYPDNYSESFRAYYKNVLPSVVRRADRIICISNTERAFIEETYPEAVNKTSVVYHGISPDFLDDGRLRSKTVLAVASFNKHKNLARMLRAFEMIMSELPHELILVGGKRDVVSSDDEIEPILSRLERTGRVRRTGYIDDEELIALYQSSEIFVFPSLFEGFGFPPLEAMAAGCAVCASGVSSMPEICGDAAEYFDPMSEQSIATAIKTLANDDAYRKDLVRRGRERAAQFTWERAGAETLRLLTEQIV